MKLKMDFWLTCALLAMSCMLYPFTVYSTKVLHLDFDTVSIKILLLPTIIMPICIILARFFQDKRLPKIKWTWMRASLLFWIFSAYISFIVHVLDHPYVTNCFFSIFVSMLVIYYAEVKERISKKEFYTLILIIAISIQVPFLAGAIAYIKAFGLFDSATFYYSHADKIRMGPYYILTLGNTSNTAYFLILIGLPIMATLTLARSELSSQMKLLLSISMGLIIINLLITSSRSSLIIFVLFSILSLFILPGKNKIGLIAFLVILIGYIVSTSYGHVMISRIIDVLFLNKNEGSISERFDAMSIGWSLFKNNLFFGIGPGMSMIKNVYTTAHQFNIEQASTLGVLGLLASLNICICVIVKFIDVCVNVREGLLEKENFIAMIGPVAFILVGISSNVSWTLNFLNVCVLVFTLFWAISESKFYEDSTMHLLEQRV